MSMIASLIGGIGFFLLGMMLMTDGLKALAGDALRNLLRRFTGGTLSAMTSGAVITALVQSSSATTLMTIGFVSAGLLTFVQAVGVIFGANIGTTSTGWLVSLIGLKFSISQVALPLVGLGVLLKQFTSGKSASFGLVLSGFGLLFTGINVLQQGMASLTEWFDLSGFAGDSILNRLLLIAVGVMMTVVMQSSSAAVAATLAALHMGAVDMHQAAALVIGQNLGTTVTAAIAAIGASIPAKRTALAHILFNALTAAAAFLVLPLFVRIIENGFEVNDPAIALAAFHTLFNLLGIMLLVPFIRPFSQLIVRFVPERTPRLARRLDDTVAAIPQVALEAVRLTTADIASTVASATARKLMRQGTDKEWTQAMEETETALGQARDFLALIRSDEQSRRQYDRHLDVLHAFNHLERLVRALNEPASSAALPPGADSPADALYAELCVLLQDIGALPAERLAAEEDSPGSELLHRSASLSVQLAEARRDERLETLKQVASGTLTPAAGEARIQMLLRLDRIAYHLWQMYAYLSRTPVTEETAAADLPNIQPDQY